MRNVYFFTNLYSVIFVFDIESREQPTPFQEFARLTKTSNLICYFVKLLISVLLSVILSKMDACTIVFLTKL